MVEVLVRIRTLRLLWWSKETSLEENVHTAQRSAEDYKKQKENQKMCKRLNL